MPWRYKPRTTLALITLEAFSLFSSSSWFLWVRLVMADGSSHGTYLVSGRQRPFSLLDLCEIGAAIAMFVVGLVFYTGWHLPMVLWQLHLWRGAYGGESQHEGRKGDWIFLILDTAVAALQYVLWSGYWSRPELDVITDPYRTREYVKMGLVSFMFLISAFRCLGVGDWWQAGGQLDWIPRPRRGGAFTKTRNGGYPQQSMQQTQAPSPPPPQVVYVQGSNPTPAYPAVPLVARAGFYPGYPPY